MKKYNTIINFVEPTMILKRVTTDTFNNTYPHGHDYLSTTRNITYIGSGSWVGFRGPQNLYQSLYGTNTTIPVKFYRLYRNSQTDSPYYMEITVTINDSVVFTDKYGIEDIEDKDSPSYPVPDDGTTVYTIDTSNYSSGTRITIVYSGKWDRPRPGVATEGSATYGLYENTMTIIDSIPPVPRIQLNEVCRRIFEGSLGRREKDPVRFKLDDTTEQWFSQITAPEYCFTRSTLYEVLMEIGGTKEVNAVPRLLWNEKTNAFDTITFIKQGDSQDEYTLPATVQLTGEEVDQAAEEYCEEFDSYAENMVNTLDATRGSIVEPANLVDSPNAYYKTSRSEELVVNDNTSNIECDKPLDSPLELRAAYNGKSVDITPYLFEAAEYDNLTSYKGAYPYAKEWALRYVRGDNKITGLCLKSETLNELEAANTQMAIYNILWRVGLLTNGLKPGICNISFRLTYIPFNTVRVKQRKPYLDWKGSGTLFYNQGGQVVEADYYGNHLKNRLARIGNPIKRYTFRLQGQVRPPKIGQVFYDEEDGELLYISQVDEERGLTYTLITMWLTRNVNRLYGYTAINSRKRQYAIDERMSVDRHINISENIYIGDSVEESDSSITNWGIQKFMYMFNLPGYAGTGEVNTAIARGMNENDYVGENAVALGVTCSAIGNSLCFNFRFKDNYSAGNQSVELASAKRMIRAVPYGDDNGMFDYLSFSLLNELMYNLNQGSANNYPEVGYDPPTATDTGYTMIEFVSSSSPHGRIPVYKDSRDIIHVEVQEHFIATRRSIIIGSELAFCNRLIRGTSGTFGVAFLPYRLNEQRETLTIQDSNKAGNLPASAVTISGRKATISARTNTTGAAAKSWAIYNQSNNRLVIGENMDIEAGGQTLPFVFNF